jgi:hypothetical protein
MTDIAHLEQAVRAQRIGPSDASDECLDDRVLHNEAMAKRLIGPGTLVAFFTKQSKEQA